MTSYGCSDLIMTSEQTLTASNGHLFFLTDTHDLFCTLFMPSYTELQTLKDEYDLSMTSEQTLITASNDLLYTLTDTLSPSPNSYRQCQSVHGILQSIPTSHGCLQPDRVTSSFEKHKK